MRLIFALLAIFAIVPASAFSQTLDDHLVISSFAYAIACEKAKVPAELHVFPKGGHGYGLRTHEPGLKTWPDLLIAWIDTLYPN